MDQHEWNEYYENTNETWAKPDSDLIAEVEQIPTGAALDLGAGEGVNSLWLAEQGWQVTAVDFAPAAVRKIELAAHQRDLPIQAQVANIVTFQAAAEYDLVVIAYVHLPPKDRLQLLMNAAKALTPNGTLLFIGFPNGAAFGEDQEYDSDSTSDDVANLFATGEEIIALLPDSLVVDKNITAQRTFPWGEDTFTSDVVVVRAHRAD
jgi:2-polyprenyl-3-methyl-5-hydroxy-6-metoxy-1,4-benzoquinol methylase